MSRFVVLLLVLFLGAVGIQLAMGADVATWLPIGLSVTAVLISLISAFRAEILPLDLVVTGGDIILSPPPVKGEMSQITLALSLGFLNKGYGEDVVEWLGLRVGHSDGASDYIPVAETDLQKVMSGVEGSGKSKKIHATNSTTFASFALHAKSSLTKTVVFSSKSGPVALPAGEWTLSVYAKLASRSKATRVLQVSHSFKQEDLDFVGAGNLSLTQAFEVDI